MSCQCGGLTGLTFTELRGYSAFYHHMHLYDQNALRLLQGVILCRDCSQVYRPAHQDHIGDGTPAQCDFCQEWLKNDAATQDAQKV
jgi:hypothetical protein